MVAHWQWPNVGYDDKAKALLTNLRKMLLTCSGKWTVYPGCSGGSPWEIADAFVGESIKLRDDYWHSSYLGNLYLLAMSGNMWNPDILGAK